VGRKKWFCFSDCKLFTSFFA